MSSRNSRPTVLVLEDEAMICLDLCDALQDAGYEVIGPASSAGAALALLEQQPPHAAIVDLRVKDGSCAPLVNELHLRGVPFMVYSGSQKDDDPDALCRGAPWVSKPSAPGDLLRTLAGLRQPALCA